MKLEAQPVDAVLQNAVEAGRVPGIAAGVRGRDGTLYESAYGLARSAEALPMRRDTIFRVASMTKPVTTLAILMLCEEGKLELDTPLSDVLPGYREPPVLESFDMVTGRYRTREAAQAVTIRQLLSHSSGYGYWFLDAPLYRLTSGSPELFDPPFLMAEPGTRFGYSVSTDVVGQVVPVLSGLSLDVFFAERIFEPLGMRDTGYALPEDRDRLSSLHVRQAQGFAEQPLETEAQAPRGGGGLFSTMPDYLALLGVFLNGGRAGDRRIVGRTWIEEAGRNQIGDLDAVMQTTALPARTNDFIFMDGTQKFGLGFMIETRDASTGRKAGSLSWAGIANTYFWIDPATGIAAVICMQLSPFADPACIDVYRRFERAVYDALS